MTEEQKELVARFEPTIITPPETESEAVGRMMALITFWIQKGMETKLSIRLMDKIEEL